MFKRNDRKERRGGAYGSQAARWLFFAHLLTCSALAAAASAGAGEPPDPDKLATPAAVKDVVHVQPFALEQGYFHNWRQERPFVKSGTLVVFKVNPDYVYPRNSAEAVLYAGNQTAQRLNQGHESGYVIAIIPGEIDLAREPAWFGGRELPERVNADSIKAERTLAEKAGIKPFDADRVRDVTRERVAAGDLASLLREHVAKLLLEHSPQEKALAETWRLPVAQR